MGEVAEITSSKRIFYSEYVPSGIPFWRSKEVIEKFNRKKISTDLFISHDKYQEIKSKFGVPQQNDILLTSVGTLGIPYLVQHDEQFYFKDGNLTWIKNIDNELLDPIFLFKWLSSSVGKESLREITIGSTQEALTIAGLKTLELLLPPLEEQRAIAEVLSSLDDKIDLLHRQNKTLEDLAQTLFRQWFIEEAREEWEEVTLSDVMELKYGKDHKHLNDGKVPIYGSGGIMRYGDTAIYNQESILIPRKGTLNNIFYVDEPFWTVDTIFWSKINSEKISGKLLFEFLKTLNFSNMNVGSAVPSLTTKVLNEISFALPSLQEQEKFKIYTDNAWDKIKQNQKQIQTLENLRDTLLPKLLSGEVRVNQSKERTSICNK
ncbi:restriction endonuclease S subunit [Sulfurospirillum barnesii SES-3]|uniref:Restriction endonuclease S subunit n=1 Tax=Sulfurospirillum barnesii (strain ATCC 700032 / DSM 10660 / SES-3) TaxID=760154 RepID=I3Y096_SULBS|nr:restriction endonuclease S subunit [Sulfurospirillum barnesii SES-3]